MESTNTPTLIYDAACPLCTRAADWVRRNALPGAVNTLPCQSEERARRFPQITEATCMEAIQLILPDGRVLAGEQALPHLFRLLRKWQWLARVVSLPGLSRLSPYAYRWIANHRHMLSAWKHTSMSEGR